MPHQRAPRAPAQTSADKVLDVLFHLRAARTPLGVTEIGRGLGLPKSSVHRLLSALARRGLVEHDARGRYRLGVGLIGLGLGVLEQEPLVAAARQAMEREAQRLGETVFLVALREGNLLVLDKAEGTGVLRAAPRIGSSVPLHATAVGKVALAWAPESISQYSLERFTANTVTRWHDLVGEAERARVQGYAVSDQEWIEGLSVVAAPVLGPQGLLGTIAIAVASARLPVLGANELGARAAAVARQVEQCLRGVP